MNAIDAIRLKSQKKPKQSLVEKNLKKLEKQSVFKAWNPDEEVETLDEKLKMTLMVMVFFKGTTKKYIIENNTPLIDTLTPQIIQNYTEVDKTPYHFFKFYNDDNEELDFTKTADECQLKYADSIGTLFIYFFHSLYRLYGYSNGWK